MKNKKMNKQALIDGIKTFLESRPEIPFAYLFGSFVDEDYFRDIDVGIYIDESDPLTRDKFYDIELSTEIENFIQSPVPVDIVILNRVSSAIVFYASKGVLLKDTDEDLREDFITLHWKMYWDFKFFLRLQMEERKNESE